MLLDKEQARDEYPKESQGISFNRVLDRPLLEMAEVLDGMAEGIQEIPQYMGWDGVAEHVVYEAAYASAMCDSIITGMRTPHIDGECKDVCAEQPALRLTPQTRESIVAPFEKLSSSLQGISESLFKGWSKNPSKRRHILNGEKYQALHCTPNSVRTPGSKVYVSPQDVGEVMPNFMKIFSKFLIARFTVVAIFAAIIFTGSISLIFDYLEPYVLPVSETSGVVETTSSGQESSDELDGIANIVNETSFHPDPNSRAMYAKWVYRHIEIFAFVVTNIFCWYTALAAMIDLTYFSFPVFREMLKSTPARLRFVTTVAYDAVESLNTPELDYIWVSKAKFVRSIAEELHKVKPSYQVPEEFLKRIEAKGFETLEDFRKAASIEVMADWCNMGLA